MLELYKREHSSMKNKHKNGIRKCPHCGSKLIKNGHDRNGKQRWYCCFCRKTINVAKKLKDKNRKRSMLAFLFKILLNKIPISKYGIGYYKFSLMIKEFESINLDFPIRLIPLRNSR